MSDPHPYAPYAEAFGKFVPGFEFLQGLARNAGQGLPGIGQWVAPTLDPQELERRIGELRTVQFWLEQNARMIATTIQALEVQRMTLGTLRSMNIPMGDLTEALRMRVPDPFAAAAAAAPTPAPAPAPAPAAAPAAAEEGPAAVDPMQWWGALTQQFTQLASQAVKATSEATAEAQARAADAMQGVMQSVAEATPVVTPATASAPEPKAARKRAAPARKAEPEPAPAPAARRRTPRT